MAEKQSHKDTIVLWHESCQLFDRGERARALDGLLAIQEPSAKILYNVGLVQWLTGDTHGALQVGINYCSPQWIVKFLSPLRNLA